MAVATLLSQRWLLMPATPWDTGTRNKQGFCRVSAACKCFLEMQSLEKSRSSGKRSPGCSRLRGELCCRAEGERGSCGRTLFPGSGSAGDGGLVASGRAEGSSPRTRAWPGRGGAGARVAPCDPMSPPATPQRVPARPHTAAWQPPAPRAALAAEGGSRWTDRQTDRQTGTCRVPRLYCHLVFSWQLRFSSAGAPCPEPSVPQRGGCQEGPRLRSGRSPRSRAAPGVGRPCRLAQPQLGGGLGGRRVSLWPWGGWAARCPPGAAGHLPELQVSPVAAPAPAPHPGSPTRQGHRHGHLHAEQEQQGGDTELGPG